MTVPRWLPPRSVPFAFASVLTLIMCPISPAQDPHAVWRWIDPTTFVLLRADCRTLDVPGAVQAASQLAPGAMPDDTVQGISNLAMPVVSGLKQTGATELLVGLSTLDVTNGKAFAIVATTNPDETAQQVTTLLGWLPPALGYHVHTTDSAVIACTDETWQRMQAGGSKRPELTAALQQSEGAMISVILGIRENLAQSVASAWPDRLPDASPVQVAPNQLMADVRSATLSLSVDPAVQMQLTVACRDASAAERVQAELDGICDTLNVQLESALVDNGSGVAYTPTGPQLSHLAGMLTAAIRENARKMQVSNDLKQLILAFHNFQQKYGGFVPRMTVSQDGKPLLSWRVHLLPFIERNDLYQRFHLDEPWDSPHNAALIPEIPQVYVTAGGDSVERGRTCVQAPMMRDSYWSGNSKEWQTFLQLSDSTETICFVVAPPSRSVIWTKPDDLLVDADKPIVSLFSNRDAVPIARFNGSVITLLSEVTPESLRSQLTHASGD